MAPKRSASSSSPATIKVEKVDNENNGIKVNGKGKRKGANKDNGKKDDVENAGDKSKQPTAESMAGSSVQPPPAKKPRKKTLAGSTENVAAAVMVEPIACTATVNAPQPPDALPATKRASNKSLAQIIGKSSAALSLGPGTDAGGCDQEAGAEDGAVGSPAGSTASTVKMNGGGRGLTVHNILINWSVCRRSSCC